MKEEFCIMPDNPPYWRNRREDGLHRHEVFFGTANRQKSIRDGLVIFLTPELHNMSNKGIHLTGILTFQQREQENVHGLTITEKPLMTFAKNMVRIICKG